MAAGIVIREAHFPGRAPIEAYGNGGFRFADMSHRGSLLCLPSGIYGWEPADPAALVLADFERLLAEAEDIEVLLVGTGKELRRLPDAVRAALKEARISVGPDVDGRRGAHLQRLACRGPRGRGGADRRRLTWPITSRLVADTVRAGDYDRYLSSLYAPEGKRAALHALYAFNVEIAGIRDRIREPMPGEIRLQWWRDVIASRSAGQKSGHPLADALVAAINGYDLPERAFDNYLEARIFDLYDDPMPSRTDLEGYCGETAGALIQLAAIVLDARAAPDFAEAAGHAGCAKGDLWPAAAAAGTPGERAMLPAARHACRCRNHARGVCRRGSRWKPVPARSRR